MWWNKHGLEGKLLRGPVVQTGHGFLWYVKPTGLTASSTVASARKRIGSLISSPDSLSMESCVQGSGVRVPR
jgi:hypothetical protein